MLNNIQIAAAIAVSFLCTAFLRFLPFLFFRKGKQIPLFIQYLGKVLPSAIMAVLVIYCLKDVGTGSWQSGGAQIAAVLFTAVLHLWKKDTYLSITAGTIFYMILIHFLLV
jgi:branched-subunit amino acid transport protein AzlD